MKKLLVVVDMQNDFIDGALGTKEAQSIVNNVREKLEKATEEGTEIIYTMDTHLDYYYDSTEEGKNLPVKHCIYKTDGWKINDLVEGYSFKYFEKETFGSDALFDELMDENTFRLYDEIELVGLCTDICVISNAIICKTAQPNAHIVVDASCCAGVTPHSHDVAIEAMKTLQIEIRNEGKEPWRK
jgi:nicotinamidase-related amidase